jgi:X-Pro dipeptidyl-peptidase
VTAHRLPIAYLLIMSVFTASLAGCSQPKHSASSTTTTQAPVQNTTLLPTLPERYLDATLENLTFTASDGTPIHATVYLPSAPKTGFRQEQRFGTIVYMNPYYDASFGTHNHLDSVRNGQRTLNKTGIFGILLTRGFAFVAASVPGTGLSGGCYDLGGLHEQELIAEFVEWTGHQPWSNGNVGMTGGSAAGTTQWMAAIHAPPSLKTIVPLQALTDWYNYGFQDGAPYHYYGAYFFPVIHTELTYGIHFIDGNPRVEPRIPDRACPEVLGHLTSSSSSFATGIYDAFWQERNYVSHFSDIKASVFLVHGLWNWNVKPVNTLGWNQIPSGKILWLQQMGHELPWFDTYNRTWDRADYNMTLLAWYDHYLNGAQNGIPHVLPAVQVQDHTGYWRNETQWPPRTESQTLYFGAGSLGPDSSASGQTTILTPPMLSTPEGDTPSPDSYPQIREPFSATFTTEPLSEPLRISGVPLLELSLSVDRPGNGHVTIEMSRIKPDSEQFLTMGGRGLAQRDNRTHNDPFIPNQALKVPIELSPTDSYLEKGDRLKITVSGENRWFQPNGNAPTIFLNHGSSKITLPVLPADTPRGTPPDRVVNQNPYWHAHSLEI